MDIVVFIVLLWLLLRQKERQHNLKCF